jgi:hypothetical protein
VCSQEGTTEGDLKALFVTFLSDRDPEKLLIAGHFDRCYAFVDLGSQEAVARAVAASLAGSGLVAGPNRLEVQPSKKPVRPSGLKAIHEKRGQGSGQVSGQGGKGGKGKGGKGKGGKGEPKEAGHGAGERP